MSYQQEKFKEIADNIRAKLGTDDLIKPSEFADKVNEVYNKGYSESESDFWDVIQRNGARKNYEYGFYYWRCEKLEPKYKVECTSRTLYMFAINTYLKEIKKEYFDLSAYIPVVDANNTSSNYYIFYGCSNLKTIEDIGLQGGGYNATYRGCGELETIEIMRCVKNGVYITPFVSCNKLKNITIEGEIGKSFDIHYSPLSTASIVSIIEHLSDTQGATLTLNTNAVNDMMFPHTSIQSGVTYNSWDELIATKTNWTISKASA